MGVFDAGSVVTVMRVLHSTIVGQNYTKNCPSPNVSSSPAEKLA